MTEYDFHPIANIFPLLQGAELQELTDDIQAHGLIHPIMIFDGQILDGRNRYRACLAAGVEPEYTPFFGDEFDAISYVWSTNIHRRHLRSDQTAGCLKLKEMLEGSYEAELKERLEMEARERVGGRPRKDEKPSQTFDQVIDDPNERRSAAKRAKMAGTNRQYVADMDKVAEEMGIEAVKAIAMGEKTLTQTKREIRQKNVEKNVAALPGDKYRIIYADPPWKYSDSRTEVEQYGPAERHYPGMPISDICALPVGDIAAENAVLFLWTTSPMLEDALKVVKAWGFTYKSSFVWDKIRHNYGHYNSVRHEFLLIATRGSCVPDEVTLFDSVQSIERSSRHSEKPQEFREIIETLYKYGKRIELFSRGIHDGWDVWGSEAN
jgi:N6-adenosine-specific RNA methylase IME4/ParB-like chromosome segregation protein Spo0J